MSECGSVLFSHYYFLAFENNRLRPCHQSKWFTLGDKGVWSRDLFRSNSGIIVWMIIYYYIYKHINVVAVVTARLADEKTRVSVGVCEWREKGWSEPISICPSSVYKKSVGTWRERVMGRGWEEVLIGIIVLPLKQCTPTKAIRLTDATVQILFANSSRILNLFIGSLTQGELFGQEYRIEFQYYSVRCRIKFSLLLSFHMH